MTNAPGTVGDGGSLTIAYNIATDDWTVLTPTTIPIGAGGDTCYHNDTVNGKYYIYCAPGGGSNAFLRYDLNSGLCETLNVLPYSLTSGASIVLGDYCIYATQGTGSDKLMGYNLNTGIWEELDSLPYSLGAGSCLTYCFTDHLLYCLQGGGSQNFLRYNIGTDSWRTGITQTPQIIGDGGAICYGYNSTLDDWHIYAMAGGETAYFWRYHIPVEENYWEETLTPTPANVGTGGAMVHANGYIYVLRGAGTTDFWKYDIVNDSWSSVASALDTVGAGGALCYDGSRYIYALRGGLTENFWRYDTTNNTWAVMNPLNLKTSVVGAGGSLCYHNGNVYAFQGDGKRFFYRYSISGDSWTSLRNFIRNVGAGGAMTLAISSGVYYIYALSGGVTSDFARYNFTSDRWEPREFAPYIVGTGGTLCTGEIRGINNDANALYSLRGDGTREFCVHSTYSHKWLTDLEQTPAAVTAGGTISSTVGAYDLYGTLASQVFDTGFTVTNSWEELSWEATIETGTAITFEVRGSDTWFDTETDDVTLPWTSVGGTSPVISGLPGNRYIQWRATLTSTLVRHTPVLHAVSVYYDGT
jgi:hypothetical protein